MQNNNNMLSSKNTTPTIRRHSPKWPSPPCRKILEGCISAIFDPILMKFGTQTDIAMLNPKRQHQRHFQRWPPPCCKTLKGFISAKFDEIQYTG
jgi:hypothetical protein